MIKNLFVYETEMPTVSITRNLWTNISKEYRIESIFKKVIDIEKADIDWCDILLLIRPNNPLSWRIARSVRRSGRLVITMCDDDLLHLPKAHPQLPWQKRGLILSLNNSNVILSSSRYLVDQLIKYTADKRGAIIDTVVKEEELLTRNYECENNEKVRIVYAAGGSKHASMFEQFALPALEKIAREKTRNFSITFISVHPDCTGLEKLVQVNYVKGMPLLEYRRYMEEQKFDIGLAPLEDSNFTRCKYFNKYLEYTLSGVTGVYSNVEPYTYVVKDGENGFLADNNDKSWEQKLARAISEPDTRIACAKNAQDHVRQNFTEQEIMDRLFTDVPEFKGYDRSFTDCNINRFWKLHYKLLRCVEYVYKTGFYMRNEGLGSVKRKMVARLERMFK